MSLKQKSKQPPFLLLGQVLRPHGVRGELRLEVMTDYPERIVPGGMVYLGTDPDDTRSAEEYEVASVRRHLQYLIIRLAGIEDRNEAETLRDRYVMVALDQAVPLEEDEFYLFQAIGLEVSTEEHEALGRVSEVIETGANDVYVVRGPRGEILIPAIDECIVEIDIAAGTMTVRLMDGLLGD
jgi:16S rRNA processing protein RimM